MKKIILAICAVVLAATSLKAESYNKPYWGARVGIDVACPGDVKFNNIGVDLYKSGAGIEFGAIYNIPVVANFYIEPGLKLYYDTYSADVDFIEDLTEAYSITGLSIRKFGARIPVMAGYHFDFAGDVKVHVFTGPELEVGLSAKERLSVGKVNEWESLYGEDAAFHRVNLLWDFGAAVSYQNYYLGISGGIGMLNTYNSPNVKFHENRVTFTLGYNF